MTTTLTLDSALYSRIIAIATAFGLEPTRACEEAEKLGGKRLMVESVAFDEENDRHPGAEGLHSMQAMRWRTHITSGGTDLTPEKYDEVMTLFQKAQANGKDGGKRVLTISPDGQGSVTITLSESSCSLPGAE